MICFKENISYWTKTWKIGISLQIKEHNSRAGNQTWSAYDGWLIDWCLMPTLAVFQLYHGFMVSDFMYKFQMSCLRGI